MAMAFFFRFFKLEEIPPGLYPDVAINGNDAWHALETKNFKVFYPENNGREGFFINLIALSFWLFGKTIWAIKIVPAFLGALTILGLYLLTKEIFYFVKKEQKEVLSLLASFLTAISFWHVNFSRLGFRAIMVPFCLVFSLYFLFKGSKITRSPLNCQKVCWAIVFFILAGAFFGLGFHTYIAFRIAPVILIPIFTIEFVRYWPTLKNRWRQRLSFKNFFKNIYLKDGWWGWDIFILTSILVFLPLGLYFVHNPHDFLGRSSQVSVFASPEPLKTLLSGAGKTLGQFIFRGDSNWRHNLAASPQIFWPLIPFFWLGFLYSFWQIISFKNYREKNFPALTAFFTLITWWIAMLLPAIMTNEGLPHALRTIGAIPPTYIFVSLGLITTWNWLNAFFSFKASTKKLFAISFIFAALILSIVEYWRYFIFWGKNSETRGAFTQNLVDESYFLNSLSPEIEKFVLVNEGGVPVPYPDGLPMPAQTIIFLTANQKNIYYLVPSNNATQHFSIGNSNSVIFIPLKDDPKIFQTLKDNFPQGQIEKFSSFSIFKANF